MTLVEADYLELVENIRNQSVRLLQKLDEATLNQADLEELIKMAVRINQVQSDMIQALFQSHETLQGAFERLQESFRKAGDVIDDYEDRLEQAARTIAFYEKELHRPTLN